MPVTIQGPIGAKVAPRHMILVIAALGILAGAGRGLLLVFLYVILGALPVLVSLQEFWFAAFAFGALAFLNTWDLPIYLVVLLGVLWWNSRAETAASSLRVLVVTAIAIGIAPDCRQRRNRQPQRYCNQHGFNIADGVYPEFR